MDLSGVSRAALLKVVKGVARGATRVKTVFQISSSGARLMTCSRSGTTELTSKSSETTSETNLERSPRRIPRPFEEGRYRANERFCNARKRSNGLVHVRKSITAG